MIVKLTFPSHARVGHGFFLLIVVDARTSSFSNIIYLIYTSYSRLELALQNTSKVKTKKTMAHILYTNIRVVRHFQQLTILQFPALARPVIESRILFCEVSLKTPSILQTLFKTLLISFNIYFMYLIYHTFTKKLAFCETAWKFLKIVNYVFR